MCSGVSGDINQMKNNNSNINSISTNQFLEFLKITCQVNDSILFGDHCHHLKSFKTNGTTFDMDYDKLASNEFINKLMDNHLQESLLVLKESEKKSEVENLSKQESQNHLEYKLKRKPSSISLINLNLKSQTRNKNKDIHNQNKSTTINAELKAKLSEIINDGILDSVLPYICPSQPTTQTQIQSESKNTIYNNSNINKGCKPKSSILHNSNLKLNASVNVTNQSITVPEKKPSVEENIENKSSIATAAATRRSEGSIKPKELKSGAPSRRKSTGMVQANDEKKEPEVIIHVCDEVKNTSKDFICPQHLLVSKMGYFADVTAGQKLEDMDISVHCDLQIFDWLMKWVKKDTCNKGDDGTKSGPQLDGSNVIPILVSASFLQMEPLLIDCLAFCHAKLNDVVRSSANLSCLNDSIISRLAAMFTNVELEMVKDKRERITPKLWTKMMQNLCEPEPQALKGHYFTLAGVYKCSKCGKYLTQSSSSFVNCIPSNTRLNRWGQMVSQHVRDLNWNFNAYITSLYKELNYSWRKVYWKLWGHCHFLYCCICETHFPAYQMNLCQFHPEAPQFLGPVTEGHVAGPTGRYSCCGQQAFRFETLPGPNGCQYREHSVLVETDRDRAILSLTQIAAEDGYLYDLPPTKSDQTQQHLNQNPRWIGMCLMPTKFRQGILPQLHIADANIGRMNKQISRALPVAAKCEYYLDSDTETESTSETLTESGAQRYTFFNTSSDGCESGNDSTTPRKYSQDARRARSKTAGRFWCGEVSARSNQDNQREFEEKVMKHVIALVNKKITRTEPVPVQNSALNGGSYVKLENEWKENRNHKGVTKSFRKF